MFASKNDATLEELSDVVLLFNARMAESSDEKERRICKIVVECAINAYSRMIGCDMCLQQKQDGDFCKYCGRELNGE